MAPCQVRMLAMSKIHVPEEGALPLGLYRHYKGGEYEVLGVATHSETGDSLVVYRCLYGDYGLWVRPLAMFQESVEMGGEDIPRFVFLGKP